MDRIPLSRKNFQKILRFYLFECPVQYNNGSMVSNAGVSFKKRKLDGRRLNTLIAAMRRSSNISINVVKGEPIAPEGKLEYLIVRERYDMSTVNAYYYAIRNALAHGSFLYEKNMYSFVNCHKGRIQAVGKIKESTLLGWIDLCNMSVENLKMHHK